MGTLTERFKEDTRKTLGETSFKAGSRNQKDESDKPSLPLIRPLVLHEVGLDKRIFQVIQEASFAIGSSSCLGAYATVSQIWEGHNAAFRKAPLTSRPLQTRAVGAKRMSGQPL